MKTQCGCGATVTGEFKNGAYHFHHCGKHWVKQADSRGQKRESDTGMKVGAAAGTVFGPGGTLIGALIGSAFDGDNGIKCEYCGKGRAYPTGKTKYSKKQYQCNQPNCKRYHYK